MFKKISRLIKKKPIFKSTIRYKEPRADVKKMEEGLLIDRWKQSGQQERFSEIFLNTLHGEPLKFLKKSVEKKPEVLFLGAGSGKYLPEFKTELLKNNIDPQIDVLSIQNSLDSRVKPIVREDHSTGDSLETIVSKGREIKGEITDQKLASFMVNRKLTSSLVGKYSLVMGSYSVGFHTNYPASNVFNACLMLKPGGRAYIQIPRFNYVFRTELLSLRNKRLTLSEKRKIILAEAKKYKFEKRNKLDPNNHIPYSEKTRILTQIEDISTYVNRMLDSFLPNLSKEYKIEYIKNSKTSDAIYLRIIRTT